MGYYLISVLISAQEVNIALIVGGSRSSACAMHGIGGVLLVLGATQVLKVMPSPWTLGAAGLTVLALLYYISWRYAARWVCRLLLQERVAFHASIKTHSAHQNGVKLNEIVEEIGEISVNREAGSLKNHRISDSGAAQRQVYTPYVVTDGVLAEVSQL